jgi:15-cis-phytoene synthase
MPLPFTDQADDDLDACVEMMRDGSKTFFAASRFLPPRVRSASIALYAFCRVADDMVDQGGVIEDSLHVLHHRLDLIYAATPMNTVEDRALCIVVQRHGLPRHLLDALLDGFAWDGHGRQYETIEDLHGYAARVAGSVGAMMCWIMGPQQATTLARACELGVAMQLTNIARDVGEDARNQRIYLPLQWLREEGLEPSSWMARPQYLPEIQRVISRILDEADSLYKRSMAGIAELPRDCRSAILAAALIYSEIGHELRRKGLDSVNQRAVVSGLRKAVLLLQARLQAGWIFTQRNPPQPLAGIAYLVEQCQETATARLTLTGFPNRAMPQRIEWMLALFENLEHSRLEKNQRTYN